MPKVYARRLTVAAGSALALVCTVALTGQTAEAAPPSPPSAATARTYLSEIKEQPEGSSDGYSRDKFPHWITQEGACNTREVVLKRDGTDVTTDSNCAAVSGTWISPYDDAKWTKASDLDIDHVVPLSEAWKSGASQWTTAHRQEFANDLTHSQLLAVTDNVNQAKGDKDPAKWLPPKASYHCEYARMWVWVKHVYELTADSAEKAALKKILDGC
ncbi:HNH endonuclease family protein [Streptomyces benahoarensis]|uniref:HNH endonuclease n=1 Tax=Streptomyces benahoarensis TaxID=2595054 RepID=A0A553ZL59_9ACTN|nr:HNH endonuclease family protein [Streptomyces benahoarensis]TSB20309.1 HNH endonuclease [Streptomyces benahoarensis]TSB42160.1 HNH endonuclease [Streptomyces benahoarensis]